MPESRLQQVLALMQRRVHSGKGVPDAIVRPSFEELV